MSSQKPITEHICDMLRERSERGLAKYGTTIDRGDLSQAEWLQHLQEELLDAAQYVEAAKRQALQAPPAAADADEDAYVIERMGKLLAEIAIIVNGPEPHDTLWSYHDLPEKVRALKQAPPAAVFKSTAKRVAALQARDAAQAPPAAAVPEGYALVPVEPTEAMLDAGHAAAWRRIPSCFDMTDAEIVYRAMLAAAVPAESVAWQYRFATPDGLTWSDWQPIPSEAMARQTVDAFGKMGTRAEWRSLNVFEWGGYAGECTDADFADERAQQPAAAVPAEPFGMLDSQGIAHEGNSSNFAWLLEKHRAGKPEWGNRRLLYLAPPSEGSSSADFIAGYCEGRRAAYDAVVNAMRSAPGAKEALAAALAANKENGNG